MSLSVVTVTPANDAAQVSLTPTIEIVFNSTLDVNTVTQSAIVVTRVGTAVIDFELTGGSIGTTDITEIISGIITVSGSTITWTPPINLDGSFEPLLLNSNYSILIGTDFTNESAESLTSIYTSNFTTTNVTTEVVDQTSVNLTTNNANIGDGKFKCIVVKPTPDRMLKEFTPDTIFSFKFNEAVDVNTVSGITVSYEGMLDDTLEEIENPGITVVGDTVSITASYTTPIPAATIFTISFDGSLASITGKLLSPISYHFIQNTSPFYVPVKLFRLRAGQLLNTVSDVTLIALISFYSLQIDVMSGIVGSVQTQQPQIHRAVKQAYVFYGALSQLLKTTRSAPPVSVKKALADFTLEVENKTQADIYNKCVQETKEAFDALKYYLSTRTDRGLFTKSFMSTNYPGDVGRLFPEYMSGDLFKNRVVGGRRSRWYLG